MQKFILTYGLLGFVILTPLAALAESASYTYDARHRLTGIVYDNGKSFNYVYDVVDNRLEQTGTNPNYSRIPPTINENEMPLHFVGMSSRADNPYQLKTTTKRPPFVMQLLSYRDQ